MVCSAKARHDAEYFLGEDAKRDAVSYYTDGEDVLGRWQTMGVRQPNCVADGEAVQPDVLRALARGVDYLTGDVLVNKRGTHATHRAGTDVVFSACKELTALWVAERDPAKKAKIVWIFEESVRQTNQFIFEQGGFEVRQGKGERSPAPSLTVASYTHITSRETPGDPGGDPQLHVHSFYLNLTTFEDGKTLSVDNHKMMSLRGAAGAYQRGVLAQMMEEHLGLKASRRGRNIGVHGVDGHPCVEGFSKRTVAINAACAAAGIDPAKDKAAAQMISLGLRKAKNKDVSEEFLLEKWDNELVANGVTEFNQLMDSAEEAAAFHRRANPELPYALDAAASKAWAEEDPNGVRYSRAELAEKAALRGVMNLDESQGIMTEKDILQAVLEECQTLCGPREAMEAFRAIMKSDHIQCIALDRGKPVYCTAGFIAAESELLRIAANGKNTFADLVRSDVLERRIRERGLDLGQAAAARHALNGDSISCIEGPPGGGKSHTLGAVAAALKELGRGAYCTSPSWAATDIIAAETKLGCRAAALAKLLDDAEKGTLDLERGCVIIVDEAGMVPLRDMLILARLAEANGWKMILAGDTLQIPPVQAGQPMSSLIRLLGGSRMDIVRRQQPDASDCLRMLDETLTLEEAWGQAKAMTQAEREALVSERGKECADRADGKQFCWMRQASEMMSAKRMPEALAMYDKAGCVSWSEDKAEAMMRLASDWIEDVKRDPSARHLAIANTNAEVHALNAAMRERMRSEGFLSGDDAEIMAIPRESGARPVKVKLAKGDRIVFGESVKVRNHDIGVSIADVQRKENKGGVMLEAEGGKKLRNSNLATVREIGMRDGVMWLTVAMDGDEKEVVSAPLEEFIGRRKNGQPRAVKLQHAYAVSCHVSQGSSVKTAKLLASPSGFNLTLVGCTRHKEKLGIYAATDAAKERLEEKGLETDQAAVAAEVFRGMSSQGLIRNAWEKIDQHRSTLEGADLGRHIAKFGPTPFASSAAAEAEQPAAAASRKAAPKPAHLEMAVFGARTREGSAEIFVPYPPKPAFGKPWLVQTEGGPEIPPPSPPGRGLFKPTGGPELPPGFARVGYLATSKAEAISAWIKDGYLPDSPLAWTNGIDTNDKLERSIRIMAAKAKDVLWTVSPPAGATAKWRIGIEAHLRHGNRDLAPHLPALLRSEAAKAEGDRARAAAFHKAEAAKAAADAQAAAAQAETAAGGQASPPLPRRPFANIFAKAARPEAFAASPEPEKKKRLSIRSQEAEAEAEDVANSADQATPTPESRMRIQPEAEAEHGMSM